jgi:hypothetical protein
LRETLGFPEALYVLLTTVERDSDADLIAEKIGFDTYVRMPVKSDELYELLKNCMAGSEPSTEMKK